MASVPKQPIKRVPTLWAALLHLAMFAAVAALFAGRRLAAFRWEALLGVAPDFYSHVSNFSITYVLYAGIGYLWLMMGAELRWIGLFGLVLAACNGVYETFIPILNTPDPIDAYYGFAGAALGFAVLWLIDRHGLVSHPAAQPGAGGSD